MSAIGRVVFSLVLASSVVADELRIATVEVANRGFITRDGEIAGSSHDLVNAIVKEAGYTAISQLYPFPRVLLSLYTGEADLALLVPNEEVNKVAKSLGQVQTVDFILIAKPGESIEQLRDIRGSRIGYLALSPTAESLLKQFTTKTERATQYSQLLNMLVADRVDYVFGPKTNIYWAKKQMGLTVPELGGSIVVEQKALHLMIANGVSDASKEISLKSALERLKKSGDIDEIIRKYDLSESLD